MLFMKSKQRRNIHIRHAVPVRQHKSFIRTDIIPDLNMKVVILAGGKGSRISEESVLKPKPMVEIGDKPILWHIMKIYSAYGYHDFIVCCGYKGPEPSPRYAKIPLFNTMNPAFTQD